jgi:hypothetical protein
VKSLLIFQRYDMWKNIDLHFFLLVPLIMHRTTDSQAAVLLRSVKH